MEPAPGGRAGDRDEEAAAAEWAATVPDPDLPGNVCVRNAVKKCRIRQVYPAMMRPVRLAAPKWPANSLIAAVSRLR